MKLLRHIKKAAAAAITCLLLLCASHDAKSQVKSIRLMLTDKDTHQPLFYAGATLINLKDSMIVCTQTTQADGTAQFNISKEGHYKLLIESEGYRNEALYPVISNNEDYSRPIQVAMQATAKKRSK